MEVEKLVEVIKEKGSEIDGKIQIPYGELFELTEQIIESLNGALKAAKKQKILDFEGEILFKGKSDKVMIILL